MRKEKTEKQRKLRGPIDRSGAETYTVQEFAKLLGIGRDVAYAAAKTKEIPAIRIGGRYLVPKALGDKMLGKTAEPRSEGLPTT
jgi:excisionase family DNA binding protein